MSSPVLAKAMSEEELLQAITEAATFLGWRWHHVRRSDKAIQMGHSGFPDLVLARNGVVLFLELKAGKGDLSPDQRAWLDEVTPDKWHQEQGLTEGRVVWPADLDATLRMLK